MILAHVICNQIKEHIDECQAMSEEKQKQVFVHDNDGFYPQLGIMGSYLSKNDCKERQAYEDMNL